MPSLTISANINGTQPGVAYNDIYLDNLGNISLSTGLQAILENCAQTAKTRLGEIVLNTQQGIPYFTTLFIGVPLVDAFNAALTSAWLAVNGVLEVLSLVTTQSGNTFFYTANIRTNAGTGAIRGSI